MNLDFEHIKSHYSFKSEGTGYTVTNMLMEDGSVITVMEAEDRYIVMHYGWNDVEYPSEIFEFKSIEDVNYYLENGGK